MNSEKMSQNAVALHNDRISHSQPMPNASFLSLAGLMAAAGRNMGQGNPFLGNPQTSLSSVPNSVPNVSSSEGGGGGGGGGVGVGVPVTSMSSHMNSFGNGVSGLGNTIISPATSMGMDQDPPSSAASVTPGITSIQPQHSRTPFPGLLNNTDWSWEFSQEGANALLERGRSRNWTYEETLELISLYTSDEWQGKFGSEKKNHRAIWAALAGALKRRKDVSGDEARQRLNNLKALYNRTRRQLLSGEISSPQWEYWEPLHAFLGRPQPFLPLPPASPLPQFPPQPFHQPFQGTPPNHHNFNRMPEMGVPHPQLTNINPHNSGNPHHHHHHNHHALLGALGLGPPFGGFHGNGNSFHKNDKTVNVNPGEPNKENEDERKSEMSNFPGPSEGSIGSAGDNPGTSDDISIPLSPEQFMSEENEPIASGGGGAASCSGPSPIPNPPRPESYKLRHNNHLTLVLESLAGDESFMDVTLTAQGKAIKAHKSVLSAVSPYFRSVLKSNPCQHPIIIMPRDIRFEELNSIISYIYRGEMTVAASELSSLLKTAEILQVTGLSPSETTSGASGIMSQVHGFPAATRIPNFNTSVSHSYSKRHSQKQNHEAVLQQQQQDQDQQQQQQQQQPQQQMEQSNADDDDDEAMNEDTSDSQGRIDPLDFLNTNMACVKEEVRSDEEAEKDDDDGEQNLHGTTSNSSPTYNERESESVSPNIQSQLSSGSVQNQLASGSVQNQLTSGSPNPFEDITSKPFNPGESDGTASENLQQESQQSFTPFGCPYCFEIFRPFETLQSHLRLKHPTKPSFPCVCGRVYFRMSTFADHSKKCKF